MIFESLEKLYAHLWLNRGFPELHISQSPIITHLHSLPEALTKLQVTNCPNLTAVCPLPESLQFFILKDCPALEHLPATLPPNLRNFHIKSCHHLTKLPEFPSTLIYLSITDCPQLDDLPSLPDSLVHLELSNFTSVSYFLRLLPDSLPSVTLNGCLDRTLSKLPKNLKCLKLIDCPNLNLNQYCFPDSLSTFYAEDCPMISESGIRLNQCGVLIKSNQKRNPTP